jgi:spermidine synthase
MAIGSWLLTKLTPQGAHPFRVVAALEFGIAIFGVAIPLALPYIQRVYLTLAEPGAGAVTLRALVCFVVLTPPTMLMGATLPAIAAAFAGQAREASTVGRLYTANLAGAATGLSYLSERDLAKGLLAGGAGFAAALSAVNALIRP